MDRNRAEREGAFRFLFKRKRRRPRERTAHIPTTSIPFPFPPPKYAWYTGTHKRFKSHKQALKQCWEHSCTTQTAKTQIWKRVPKQNPMPERVVSPSIAPLTDSRKWSGSTSEQNPRPERGVSPSTAPLTVQHELKWLNIATKSEARERCFTQYSSFNWTEEAQRHNKRMRVPLASPERRSLSSLVLISRKSLLLAGREPDGRMGEPSSILVVLETQLKGCEKSILKGFHAHG